MTSPHVYDSGIRDIFCLSNPGSLALESGIQLKECGIPLTIGIQNLSFNEKDWNQVPGIQNPRLGIWNPKTVLDSFTWGDMTG